MAKLDWEAMPLDELWHLHEQIGQVLSERILAEKQELEKRLAQLGGGRDGVVVSLTAKSNQRDQPRRKYPQVFPKYQNPNDPSETWSGRGKQPRWLVAALKQGGKIDDYRIPSSDARSRARS
jgi:DNA-binding protein H-NS